VHDNAVDTWGEPSYPNAMLEQWLGLDARTLSIEDFTYWGGLVQGEGLREYIENFRRRMYRSAGAAFWMFNDCWPATRSWTIVDYYLRRTPAFAAVKRAFEPIHVVVVQEGDEIVVFGVNDTQIPRTLDLRYGVFAFTGSYLIDRSASVTLPPNASTSIARFARDEWTDLLSSTAFAVLTDQGRLISRNRLILPLFKELVLPVPEIRVHLQSGKAIFESATFAWGVCLDLQGDEALEDNFFDLYPNIRHEIIWNRDVAPQIIRLGNLSSTQEANQWAIE
jgi:beta-mannosidase